MQPAGIETLALWRESGEWWQGHAGREVHRFIDATGARREVVTPFQPDGKITPSSIRIRRVKDEKVSLATGHYTPNSLGIRNPHKCSEILLHAQSAYAFGRGTILAGELAAFAAERGYGAVLLADPYSLVGAREFSVVAHEVGVKPLIGATFEMEDGGEIVLVARNAAGYRSLSRLITSCHLNEPRLFPLCTWQRLQHHYEGLTCLTAGSMGLLDLCIARRDFSGAASKLERLVSLYGRTHVFVQIERSYLPWQMSVEKHLLALSRDQGVAAIPGGPTLMVDRSHFPAHDVLVCAHTLSLIEEVEGRKPHRALEQPQAEPVPRRSMNAERHMRDAVSFTAMFADQPQLIENLHQLVQQCDDHVLPGRVNLPKFCDDEDGVLKQIVELGAHERYARITGPLRKRIDLELNRMMKLGWSRHFLIAWEMCEWARDQQILFSGRGSVVDSVVAYCLGFSRIDAYKFDLYFDRFLPPDGSKRPDIDIDFEAARREDVRQHLVQRYGDAHVATVAAIGTYGSRGIIRQVGKVMGIPEDMVAMLAKKIHGSVSAGKIDAAIDSRPELRDSHIPREHFYWVFALSERMMDIPTNLRSHSSGVVLSEVPIQDIVPLQISGVEEVKIIQWDKRTAKYAFDKFDVLCLRGNDVLGGTSRKAGGLDVTSLPLDDPNVYHSMRQGQLIGIPQSASPAMRQAHMRIKTKNLKDAAIVQAGIRPGVGGAVKLNEYIARRQGKRFTYVHPDLEAILGPTLGIVVFQEQIDQLLETFGGYSGDEAEAIRDLIQKHHSRNNATTVCEEIRDRFLSRGYSNAVADEVYTLVSGFKGYGFAEGHAYAFAEISVRSIYCQQNFPAPYFAALLDAQPAGYYGPITIANEARSRGVKVLPPDVNLSKENFQVETIVVDGSAPVRVPDGGIRVPLQQVGGVSKPLIERILAKQPFNSLYDFCVRADPNRDELECLILAGAFDSIEINRRRLLWAVNETMEHAASARLAKGCLPFEFIAPPLPNDVSDFSLAEKAIYERKLLGMDVERHLMAFERDRVRAKGGLTAFEASNLLTDEPIFVVGNPIRLRFPPTESGKRVLFFDLEDETGLLNVTCFDDVYQRDGHKVICSPYVTLWGTTQNRDGHIAFLARKIHAYQPTMQGLAHQDVIPIKTSDFLVG